MHGEPVTGEPSPRPLHPRPQCEQGDTQAGPARVPDTGRGVTVVTVGKPCSVLGPGHHTACSQQGTGQGAGQGLSEEGGQTTRIGRVKRAAGASFQPLLCGSV